MLHIVTPLYRYDLLLNLYASIPAHQDITWHISHKAQRPLPDLEFLKSDSRLKIYAVECDDWDTVKKRNAIFQNIQDGFFHLLDDDTFFLVEMYLVYQKYMASNFDMVIGKQIRKNGEIRLNAEIPHDFGIDSGNVLCHHSALRKVRWENVKQYCNDYFFWDKCYKYLGKDRVILIDNVISIYNAAK